MVKFERQRRTETHERKSFAQRTVDVEEDNYTIEADTAGEVCVTMQAVEREKGMFINGQ